MRGRPSRVLARVGAGVAALAVVALTAGPAFAIDGKIDQFPALPNGHLGILFSAVGLAPGETIDLASVKVSIDDQVASGVTAQLVSDTTSKAIRQTMLTIDVSGSMNDPIGTTTVRRIDAAKKAAEDYLKAVPSDVFVGLVTFESTANEVVAPTQSHAKVRDAIAGLKASNGSTALYNGVALAQARLTDAGGQTLDNILLLADGANDVNNNAASSTLTSLAKSNVSLDAVSIGSDAQGFAQLAALAKAGNGGKTVPAQNVDTLTSFFTTAANDQANQIVIDVPVPPNVAGTSSNVAVSATAGDQTIGDSAVALLPAAATAGPTSPSDQFGPVPVATTEAGIWSQRWLLPVAIAAVAIGLFGLLAIAFMSSDRENQTSGRIRRRLSRYSLSARQEPTSTVATSGALGQSQVARSAVEFAGRVVQRRDLESGLGTRLEAAGIPLKPAEWMLIHLGITVAAGLVFTLLSGFGLIATLVGLGLGLVLPFLYLSIKESRRKSEFAKQLPDTLQLLSGSLAAGYSLPQAVDTVVRESSGPMAAELNRALVETRLGVPMEDALDTVARRMDSIDFAWVVMAIRIQRDVGGNLAEVLSTVAATMRERERLRRQVDVLSAEGRLSAIILGALPLLFVLYLVLVRPAYIGLLITSPLGIMMIVVGVSLLVGGAFWLRKVVTVEV